MQFRAAEPAAQPSGLTITLEVLSKTHNEAAVDLLLAALDHPQATIREGALEALLSAAR